MMKRILLTVAAAAALMLSACTSGAIDDAVTDAGETVGDVAEDVVDTVDTIAEEVDIDVTSPEPEEEETPTTEAEEETTTTTEAALPEAETTATTELDEPEVTFPIDSSSTAFNISALQQMLLDAGFLDDDPGVDGIWGEETTLGLRLSQDESGLGVGGPATAELAEWLQTNKAE